VSEGQVKKMVQKSIFRNIMHVI